MLKRKQEAGCLSFVSPKATDTFADIGTSVILWHAVGVFEEEYVGAREAFLQAVGDVNAGRNASVEYALIAHVVTARHDDSFTTAKKGSRKFTCYCFGVFLLKQTV